MKVKVININVLLKIPKRELYINKITNNDEGDYICKSDNYQIIFHVLVEGLVDCFIYFLISILNSFLENLFNFFFSELCLQEMRFSLLNV